MGEPRHLAARCRYLRMTLAARAGGVPLNICRHIVREGRECVGPFLEETQTSCGLWEPAEAPGGAHR